MTYDVQSSLLIDVERFNANIKRVDNALKNLQSTTKGTDAQLAAAAKTLQRAFDVKPDNTIRAEIKLLQDSYKALEDTGVLSLNELRKANQELQKKTKELNNELKGLTQEVTAFLAVSSGIAFSALSLGLATATGEAIKLHDAIVGINQIGSFDNKALDGIKSDLLDLSRQIPLTTAELAEIAKGGVQANIPTSQLKEYTFLISQVASAFEILPEAATNAFGAISNVYNLNIEQLRLVGDAINKLADTTAKVTERDLINVVQRSAGAAQALGLTAQQLAALGASLLSFGSAPEVAATAINSMLLKLSTAQVQTKDFREGIVKLGLNLKDFSKLATTDGQGALNLLLSKLAGLDKLSRNNAVATLFGSAGEETQAILKLLTNLEQYNIAQTKVANVADYAGNVNKAYAASLDSIAKQFQILKNNFSEFGVSIGDSFLPLISPLIQGLSTAIKAITDFTNEFPKITLVVIGGLTAIIGLFGAVAVSALASIPSIAAFGTALYTALAPVLPIIAGVTAGIGLLVAGALLIPPAIDKVKNIFDTTFITIGDQTRTLTQVISATFSFIKDALVAVADFVSDRFLLVFNGIKNYFIAIGQGISQTANEIANVFGYAFNEIGKFGTYLFNNIKKDIQDFGNLFGIDIIGGFQKAFEYIGNLARDIANKIKRYFADAFNFKIDTLNAEKLKEQADATRQFRIDEAKGYNNLLQAPAKPATTGGRSVDFSKISKDKGQDQQNKEILASLQKLRDSRQILFAQIKVDNDKFIANLSGQSQELSRNLSDGLVSAQTYYLQALGNLTAETQSKKNNLVKQITQLNEDLAELNRIQEGITDTAGLAKIQKERDSIIAKKIDLFGQIQVLDIDYNNKKTGLQYDKNKKELNIPEIKGKLSLELVDRNIKELQTKINLDKQQNIASSPLSAFAETFNATNLQEQAQKRLLDLEKQKIPVQLAEIERLKQANIEREKTIRTTNNNINVDELIATDDVINKNLESISNLKISIDEFKTKLLEFQNLKNIFKDLGEIGIGAITNAFTELESGSNRGIRAIKRLTQSILEGIQQLLQKALTNQIAGLFIDLLASATFRTNLKSNGFGAYGSGTTSLDGIGRATGGLADEPLGNIGGIGHKGEFVFTPDEVAKIGKSNLDYLNGYTGNGGKYQEAGLLKRGSYVINKASTNSLGLDFLNELKNNTFPTFGKKIENKIRSLKGYAEGGLVAGANNTQPIGTNSNTNSANNQGLNIKVEVINNNNSRVQVDRARLFKESVLSVIIDDIDQVGEVGRYFKGA